MELKVKQINDAFILDAGTQLFTWNGKGANKREKRKAFKYTTQYLKDQGRSDGLPMVSVAEGKQPGEFWSAMSGQRVGGDLQMQNHGKTKYFEEILAFVNIHFNCHSLVVFG